MIIDVVGALLNKKKWGNVVLTFPRILICVIISLFSSVSIGNTSSKELIIYNWDDYMPQSVIDEFYEQTGYKVRQLFFESEQVARELVIEKRGKGMDLMVISRAELNVLMNQKDIFAPIPYDELTNIRHLDPIWKTKSADIFHIGFPWLWGTTGILYRKDLVDIDTLSWMDLMSPPPQSKGKVIMIPAMRDLMSSALLAINESVNTNNDDILLKASELLQSQKDDVVGYKYITSELISGQAHMALSYSTDAVELLELDDNMAYVLPNTKTVVWLNNIAVFQSSPNKDIAFRFIDFLNEPRRAASIAEYLSSSSTNRSAAPFFSDEYLREPSLNVSRVVLETAEMYEALKPELTSKYNAIYYNTVRPEL